MNQSGMSGVGEELKYRPEVSIVAVDAYLE